MYTAIGSLSCKNWKLRIQAGSDIKEGRWKWKQSIVVVVGGERKRESMEERKRKWYLVWERDNRKKQEGNGKVWVGRREERERETGKERLVRRKVGEGRREFYHGVQWPTLVTARRVSDSPAVTITANRERMRFAASYLVTFLMFQSSMKSVLSKHFRFHLVSIREEAQYFSLSLSVFFHSDFLVLSERV